MAGTFTATSLANGQIATTQAAIFTATDLTYVKKVILFNSNAATQTVRLWINPTGTARRWRQFVLAQNESAEVTEHGEALILESGDTIEADTTTAAAVDYVLCGVVET